MANLKSHVQYLNWQQYSRPRKDLIPTLTNKTVNTEPTSNIKQQTLMLFK